MVADLDGPLHSQDCGCQPCQVKRACLREFLTPMAQNSQGILELIHRALLPGQPASSVRH